MPRNGSGTFTFASPPPFTARSVISSSAFNTAFADIATALTASLTADGQKVPTANLPMGGRRHTGVSDATARTDYLALGQFQDAGPVYAQDSGSANVYVATLSPAISARAVGMVVRFKAANTNTGASTLNVNGTGAAAIRKNGGTATALGAGDIVVGSIVECVWDGTYWQFLGKPPDPFGLFPGAIILFSGAIASIPAGWQLCDGTNGTPNLRNRFVVGAGDTYAVNDTGGAATPTTSSGGAHTHTITVGDTALTIAQLPAHGHPFRTSTNISSASTATGGLMLQTVGSGNNAAFTGTPSDTNGQQIGGTGSGDTHTHTGASASDGAHTHTVSALPPYYALAYIMKL
jgi:hypothetical protein